MSEKYSQAVVDQVHELYENGGSYKQISRMMGWGVNPRRVRYIVQSRKPSPKSLFAKIQDLFTRL
jgi:hypothetical protein